jgi:thymidylate kinase
LPKPLIVVWEGLDAAGKTTLIVKVRSILESRGCRVSVHKTPSNSKTGELAKTYGNDPEIDHLTRMLLFLANTSDDSRILKRIIAEGSFDFFFIDRYYLCSIAYGFALSRLRGARVSEQDFGTFLEVVERLGEGVFIKPDIYLIIDAPEEDRVRRLEMKEGQGGLEDMLERNSLMQQYVREFYNAFREMRPGQVSWIINPQGMADMIADRIARLLLERLKS